MSVDIISEQCRRILGDGSEVSIRQESGFHQSLEAVADAQNQAAACDKRLNGCRNLLIVKDIGNEFSASVRLVACRESAAEHQNLTFVNVLLHLVDGVEDVLLRKVAEHACLHLCTCLVECLGGIVIAVRSGEYRQISHRLGDFLALVFKIYLLGLVRFDTFHPLKQDTFHIRCAGSRINLLVAVECALQQRLHRDVLAVYTEGIIDPGSDSSEELRILELDVGLGLKDY